MVLSILLLYFVNKMLFIYLSFKFLVKIVKCFCPSPNLLTWIYFKSPDIAISFLLSTETLFVEKKKNNLFWETQESCFLFPFVHPCTQSDYLIILVHRGVSATYCFCVCSLVQVMGGTWGESREGNHLHCSLDIGENQVDL